jgi:hypothetical protein
MSNKRDIDGDMSIEHVGEHDMNIIPCSSVIVGSTDADEEGGSAVMVVIAKHAFSLRTREQLEHLIGCLRSEADLAWPESAGKTQ